MLVHSLPRTICQTPVEPEIRASNALLTAGLPVPSTVKRVCEGRNTCCTYHLGSFEGTGSARELNAGKVIVH